MTGAAAALAAAALLVPAAAAARPGGLTALERAGKRVYAEGKGAGGREINAFVGASTPVSAAILACASCHGTDGLGRPEGGVVPSPITWPELTRRGGHLHPAGRRHPAFDARSLARAVIEGVDPAGNALDPAMPRYSLSREDAESLVAYLKALERDLDPGVSPGGLRIATVLPTRGHLAEVGAVMRGVLEASFAGVNAAGGIHGRRVELAVAGYDGERGDAAAALARLLAEAPPFAVVAGLAPGAEEALAELAEREKVPLVAPLGSAPAAAAAGRYAFYALAGVREQARVLARWAAGEPGATGARTAVVHGAGAGLEEAARAAAAELALAGLRDVAPLRLEAGHPDAAVARLAAAGVERILFLGDDDALRAFTARADALGFAPRLAAPGALAARAAATAPPSFDGRIFLAYPSRPAGERPGALEPLERLRRDAGLADRHRTAQVAAFTAAAVLQEALRRAGRALTRERLVDALEGLFRFDTGVVPPLSFGPARRIGALGGYVVAVDLGRRAFAPASGWISLE